jgi:hypothetical protein
MGSSVWVGVFLFGLLAYSGIWRNWWTRIHMTTGYPPFAGFFAGIFLMLLTAHRSVLEIDSAVLTVVYGLLLAAVLVVGITAWFWLPAAMLPAWLREQKRAEGEACIHTGMPDNHWMAGFRPLEDKDGR